MNSASIQSKCKSLSETMLINERGAYLHIPLTIQDFCIQNVSRSAMVLWEKIRAYVGASSDWSIIISNKKLGKKMNRTAHTIYRQLNELISIGLIEKIQRSGRCSLIKVRFPKAVDEMKMIFRTPRKNAGGQRPQSYLYNTNNNKTSNKMPPEPTTEPKVAAVAAVAVVAVVAAVAAVAVVAAVAAVAAVAEIVVDCSAETQKHKTEIQEIGKEIHELIMENPGKAREIHPQLEELYRKESILKIKIERLKPPKPTCKPFALDHVHSPGARIICDFQRERLVAALKSRPDANKIMNEIAFTVRKGSLQKSKYGGPLSVPHGISIALKVVREDLWETPRGMSG